MTLNILSVADPYIDLFITSDPGCNYLYDHVQYLISHVVELDGLMRAAEGASPSALSSLDSQMDEVDDVISYRQVKHLLQDTLSS